MEFFATFIGGLKRHLNYLIWGRMLTPSISHLFALIFCRFASVHLYFFVTIACDTFSILWHAELQQCSGAYRITPVDVISRPSSCLTNFLLTGVNIIFIFLIFGFVFINKKNRLWP